jgi:hypothetical protein
VRSAFGVTRGACCVECAEVVCDEDCTLALVRSIEWVTSEGC